jgi:hypothetical protein
MRQTTREWLDGIVFLAAVATLTAVAVTLGFSVGALWQADYQDRQAIHATLDKHQKMLDKAADVLFYSIR